MQSPHCAATPDVEARQRQEQSCESDPKGLYWPLTTGHCTSSAPHHPAHRLNQLRRVIPDAVLENRLHVFDVLDLLRRIALDHDQIRLLPRSDRSNTIHLSQI